MSYWGLENLQLNDLTVGIIRPTCYRPMSSSIGTEVIEHTEIIHGNKMPNTT